MKNKVLTILLLLLPVVSIFAQVPPPPDQGEDGPTPGSTGTPIDQYVLILLVVVTLLSVYYVWNQRKLVNN